jgi:hypothetical protein
MSPFVAAIFDPLGLISPVVVVHSTFMQQLWLHKLDWHKQLPSELLNQWMDISLPLSQMKEIVVDILVSAKVRPT